MARKTEIKEFKIFRLDGGWRAMVEIESQVELGGPRDPIEVFSASINYPIKVVGLTPDEIKTKVFDDFRAVFKEVGAVLEHSSFDALWPKDIFEEGAK